MKMGRLLGGAINFNYEAGLPQNWGQNNRGKTVCSIVFAFLYNGNKSSALSSLLLFLLFGRELGYAGALVLPLSLQSLIYLDPCTIIQSS